MMPAKKGLVDLERGRSVIEAMRLKIKNGDWDGRATIRATARLVDEARIEGRVGKFHFTADEPPERGGKDAAPSPLQFFVIGAAFCMVSQVAQFSPEFDVVLDEVKIDLRAEFDSSDKYGFPGAGTAFQKATVKLSIASPSPIDRVRALIKHAEKGCHAVQSLRNPVPVSYDFDLNGETLKLEQGQLA
jgi:uncharacterized OsmC-like protein